MMEQDAVRAETILDADGSEPPDATDSLASPPGKRTGKQTGKQTGKRTGKHARRKLAGARLMIRPGRHLLFGIGVLALVATTFAVLTYAQGLIAARSPRVVATCRTMMPSAVPAGSTPRQTLRQSAATAQRGTDLCRYQLGIGNAGVMLVTPSRNGILWFGEMLNNRLSHLDPRTGTLDRWQPPGARNGIMLVALDAHGAVWFSEQRANYLGRFDPVSQRFTTFPLAAVDGHPAGPEDLQFDATGQLWFTEQFTGRIGRLDPATSAIHMWPVLDTRDQEAARPFGLRVTRGG